MSKSVTCVHDHLSSGDEVENTVNVAMNSNELSESDPKYNPSESPIDVTESVVPSVNLTLSEAAQVKFEGVKEKVEEVEETLKEIRKDLAQYHSDTFVGNVNECGQANVVMEENLETHGPSDKQQVDHVEQSEEMNAEDVVFENEEIDNITDREVLLNVIRKLNFDSDDEMVEAVSEENAEKKNKFKDLEARLFGYLPLFTRTKDDVIIRVYRDQIIILEVSFRMLEEPLLDQIFYKEEMFAEPDVIFNTLVFFEDSYSKVYMEEVVGLFIDQEVKDEFVLVEQVCI
ncbi:hypothetical protein L6452_02320 [Arctium lappa]|uniref:Uncharacterized protein n=1 Tax=Arctium lappa TaxID=4217 RepID=A0ACB9FKL5_ARCLA|nr:hypothetical protein L6452_02320 [Arctium lappa]